jgi:hypothetical protein
VAERLSKYRELTIMELVDPTKQKAASSSAEPGRDHFGTMWSSFLVTTGSEVDAGQIEQFVWDVVPGKTTKNEKKGPRVGIIASGGEGAVPKASRPFSDRPNVVSSGRSTVWS